MSVSVDAASTKAKKKPIAGKAINLKEKYREMKESIKKFKKDLEASLTSEKVLENAHFKQCFFRALENLVRQAEMLKDDNLKASKIDLVYDWYKKKTQFFYDLNPIDKKSHQAYFEVLPDIFFYPKDETHEAKNYPKEFEKEFRSEIGGIVPKHK